MNDDMRCWCGRPVVEALGLIDLDPGDPEVGPRPEVVGFCSAEHRREYVEEAIQR